MNEIALRKHRNSLYFDSLDSLMEVARKPPNMIRGTDECPEHVYYRWKKKKRIRRTQ